MLLIDCPYCGARPEVEFRYGGEAHLSRVPSTTATTDAQWTEYLYFRSNARGAHAERWRHVHGCGRFFNAIRNTLTDRFSATYPTGQHAPPEGQPREPDGVAPKPRGSP